MVHFVMSYCLANPNNWKKHEELVEKLHSLLIEMEGVKQVEYYYTVVGGIRWKRFWLIEMTSMSVREQFYTNSDLVNALGELTALADPSTHADMFWEKGEF